MVTRNLKELMNMMLTARDTPYGIRPVRSVSGRIVYAAPKFHFPGSVTLTPTLNEAAAGISIGTGSTPAAESDYQLAAPVTEGVNMVLTETTTGSDTGAPWLEMKITVTNTGAAAVTVSEIGYKQTVYATVKPGSFPTNTSFVCLLDRTVFSQPMTLVPGDAGVIVYRLKALPPEYGRTVSGVKMVDFSYGTDEEIAAMIDAARQGTIDLQQDGRWQVGDVRAIQLGAFTGGNKEFPAGTYWICISDFREYNGCGNVMQFDFCNVPPVATRMNPTNSTEGGYGAMEMYTTTLPAMVQALPAWLKNRLKTFSVVAGKGGADYQQTETVGGNKLALRSEVEVFGTVTYSQPGEGIQAALYKIPECRIKKKLDTDSGGGNWRTRSLSSATRCALVNGNGNGGEDSLTWEHYFIPFGCL